jgi:hypothetical protein
VHAGSPIAGSTASAHASDTACWTPPAPPSWTDALQGATAAANQQQLDEAASKVFACLEDELAGIFQVSGPSFRGRGQPLKLLTMPHQSPRIAKEPALSRTSHAWLSLADACEQQLLLRPIGEQPRLRRARGFLSFLVQSGALSVSAEVRWWTRLLGDWTYASNDVLCEAFAVARISGRSIAKAASSHRAAAWAKWVADATQGGAGRAHRWTRAPIGFQASSLVAPAGAGSLPSPASSAQELRLLQDKWAGHWAIGRDSQPIRWAELSGDPPVDPPTPEAFRAAIKSIKRTTAVGFDRLGPAEVLALSEQGLAALLQLVWASERLALWPTHGQAARIVLLPKATGGVRPIALMPFFVRVQARLRQQLARSWEAQHARTYHWGAAGRSAEQAVWSHALWAEWVSSRPGLHAGLVLCDIQKAFDSVPFNQVIAAARSWGFPLWQVALSLRAYSAQRVLQTQFGVSQALVSKQGLLPGDPFATTLLKLVLLGPCDRTRLASPRVALSTYVDDLGLLSVGSFGAVLRTLTEAGHELQLQLDGVRLGLAPDKTQVLATSPELGSSIASALSGLGAVVTTTTKHLGIDFAIGRALGRHVVQSRIACGKVRVSRIRRLRASRAKAAQLAQAGLRPSLLYGASVAGVPSQALQAIRIATAAAAFGKTSGKSTTLLFATDSRADFDPIFGATLPPLLAWATAVWTRSVPLAVLEQALQAALVKVGLAARPWARVQGPAGVVVLTLRRVGWRANSATSWTDHDSHEHDLTTSSPHTVGQHLRRACWCWCWRSLAKQEQFQHIAGGAFLAPVLRRIRAWSKGKHLEVGAPVPFGITPQACAAQLRSAVVGGQWPEQRLAEAGYLASPACAACAAPAGTLHHRTWECSAFALAREAWAPLMLGRTFTQTGPPWDLLWSRALFPVGALPPEPTQSTDYRTQGPAAEEGHLGSEVFLDGSAAHPSDPLLRRAGWAAVSLSPRTDTIEYVAFGALPGPLQSSTAAEIYALLQGLRLAGPLPTTFYSDSSVVCGGWQRLAGLAARPLLASAELWREIARLSDDRGNIDTILKVKAHTTSTSAPTFGVTPRTRFGNAAADHWARQGVLEHPSTEAVSACRGRASRVIDWVGSCIGVVGALSSASRLPSELAPRAPLRLAPHARRARGLRQSLALAARRGHRVRWAAGAWRCLRCHGAGAGARGLRSFASPCIVAVAAVAAGCDIESDGPDHCSLSIHCEALGHRISRVGCSLIFCERCAGYAATRLGSSKLGRVCAGAPTRAGAYYLRRLRLGQHPLTAKAVR